MDRDNQRSINGAITGGGNGNGKSAGFTLVEALCAMLITGILALAVMASYQSSSRRFELQNEAIMLATRVEQARTFAQSQSTSYRIELLSNGYMAEMFDRFVAAPGWVPARRISQPALQLNPRVTYGTTGAIASSPNGQPFPLQPATELRFNSRGFPIDALGVTQPNNAIYLTDGRNNFAVTVDMLGRVQVWNYIAPVWVAVSQ